ncbi:MULTISPECIES: acetate--CoA ligase family protein [unclassified Blastococcus]
MTTQRLQRLFHPRSVAVVGASPKGGYGLTTLENMRGIGFAGRLQVVHPTLTEVDGVPAVPSLSALDEVPDAIAVAVPARAVPDVLAEAAELGVGGGVVYASGFAELGPAGRDLQKAIVDACGDTLPIVGPNCLGVASYRGKAALWGITLPTVHAHGEGTLALAAQSGNMALTAMLSGRLPGVAYGVSLGNQANVDVTDCLEFYLSDPQVRVVALIIEGLRDLPRFRSLALQAAEADVAVVALKVGRSSKGEAATVAHTGTLAGKDAAYTALFQQTGVIRVDDLDELIAVSSLLAARSRPRGRSLGIFASSGGECGLVADLAEDHGVRLAELDAPTRDALATVLPEYGSVGNPFDLTAGGWGQQDVYATTATALATCPDVDVVAFVGDAPTHSGSLEESGWPAMVSGAGKAAAGTDVPVALVTTTTDVASELSPLCQEHGVVLLAGLRPALRAMWLVGERSERLARRKDTPTDTAAVPPDARRAARALVDGQTGALSETTSKELVALYGIPVPDGGSVPDGEAAVALADRIGYPVVCKIEADGLAHKSDIGGVVVGIDGPDALRRAVGDVLDRARRVVPPESVRGVRVEQAAAGSGVEIIVGGHNDASGTVVVVGAGGVLTELLADAGSLLWPFGPADVRELLESLRVGVLLRGHRGSAPVDLDTVCDIVVRTGQLLADLPEIAEIDINPLLCGPSSDSCLALDALVVAGAPTQDSVSSAHHSQED